MIYFGENNEYILCECETCKGEMYIERSSVAEEDAYAYHLQMPVKCRCGAIDEYINRAKKSCHNIKHELSILYDLLRKQQNASNKISEITAELNKKYDSPSFLQSIGRDVIFALKVFLILLGSVIGLEIFMFILTVLMFFFGLLAGMPDLSRAGNELFYSVNIFKDMFKGKPDGFFATIFSNLGFPVSSLDSLSPYASEQIIFNYIPYAIAGLVIIVFYIFLAVLLVRVLINVAKLTLFAGKVVNQKLKINQMKEEYRNQLDDLSRIYQSLSEQINGIDVLPPDYKNLRAVDLILRYFINNRVDTIREAISLFHEDDFKIRQLEYNKAMYSEAKQTRRYTKALYMLTSDENIKVDVKDVKDDSYSSESSGDKVGEMLKNAFAKIRKSSPSRVPRLTNPASMISSNKNGKKISRKSDSEEISEIFKTPDSLNDLNNSNIAKTHEDLNISNFKAADTADKDAVIEVETVTINSSDNLNNSERREELNNNDMENIDSIFDGVQKSNADENL